MNRSYIMIDFYVFLWYKVLYLLLYFSQKRLNFPPFVISLNSGESYLFFPEASLGCFLFAHSVMKYISTSFAASVLVSLSLTAIPLLHFLHGWRSTVSAAVTRLNVQVKASVMYLLYTDGKKKQFSEVRKQ